MIGPLLLTVATTQSADTRGEEKAVRLELLQQVAAASSHATDQYRCRGYSRKAAQRQAKRALGRYFDQRVHQAVTRLAALYGNREVEDATEMLPIGHVLTKQYCVKVRGIVDTARSSLTKLEYELGAN